jgi:ferrous iron transport protein A
MTTTEVMTEIMERRMKLGELRRGMQGRVVSIDAGDNTGLARRLMDLGFLEGEIAEVLHEAPFGGDPFAIKIRGSLIALRRAEANAVTVLLKESV